MIRLLTLLICCALNSYAQTELKFNQKIIDCEDRWIALPTENGYAYGFVYLDNSAGLTLLLNGSFTISENNTYVSADTGKKIIRIMLNVEKAALIPKEKFSELHIQEVPAWLAFYRTTNKNIDRLYRLGYVYNRWNEQAKALEYFDEVKKKDRKYPGLDGEYELAYRRQEKFDESERYFYRRLRITPHNTDWNKCKNEIYFLTKANEMIKAESVYTQALRSCADETIKADMAYNIAFQYYKLKDKTKFMHWQNEVNRWVIPEDIYTDKMNMMATKL